MHACKQVISLLQMPTHAWQCRRHVTGCALHITGACSLLHKYEMATWQIMCMLCCMAAASRPETSLSLRLRLAMLLDTCCMQSLTACRLQVSVHLQSMAQS